jgi:hypothetical protein
MGLSYPEIGKRLNVDASTAQVLSIQGHHDKTTKKLSTHEELVIIETTLENPGAYFHELHLILQSTGTNASTSTIYNFQVAGIF